MKEKYLPIGSVVLLKNGTKKLMISSYLIFSAGEEKEKKMFDYGGCPFPEGIIESEYAIGFNHEDIAEVIHVGLEDDEQKKLNDVLNKTAEDIKKNFMNETNNN